MGSTKAMELRALLGLAVKLRVYANTTDDPGDTELFLSAALALEDRANRVAFGDPGTPSPQHQKIDIFY
jgi:hypothetical protein